ncbi:5d4a44aa-86ba-4e72-875e-179cc1f6bc52 [Sclerotinia trifoliorum]|uniref:Cx9C motif-containing protein 4, mitochondrial n=1 Tax=Sclerotinia trifoliorum TaxID=28548 RepID=A0A8H2VYW4_9HELO|nr:5d4a44aa-86ba-4e72-875e-179cc1f6bc52 [Sclerotinia trifoliorum]
MPPKNDTTTEQPCHSKACAIQECLAKNSYNEEKCRSQVDALYDCCNAFYAENGDDAKTVSCPKANLLRLKMKQRSGGKQS